MPLAAVRAKGLAFLISISGAAIPAAETTIDQAQNEMTAAGMKPEIVAEIVAIMKLQYQFARTGQGWDDYAAARARLAGRIGRPPDTIPGTPDHPYWQSIRQWLFYDPAPTLRQLRVPVLAMFGELDTDVVATKNRVAWETALKAGGHPDYTLRILQKANHYQWEATTGSNAEMASLQRFVPDYFRTIDDWLSKRVPGFGASTYQVVEGLSAAARSSFPLSGGSWSSRAGGGSPCRAQSSAGGRRGAPSPGPDPDTINPHISGSRRPRGRSRPSIPGRPTAG